MGSIDADAKHFPNAAALAAADEDPGETREWLDALAAVVRDAGRERGAIPAQAAGGAGAAPRHRRPRSAVLRLPEHHSARTAGRPIRAISRIERAHHLHHALECARDGGARQSRLRRTRRAHRELRIGRGNIRNRLQPFFSRRRGRRRRPGLLPAAFGARGLCARFSRRPARPKNSSPTIARKSRGKGLSSYPHPWLMPEFWQFPTGSMGIGPISAIYQARFMRYLRTSRNRRRPAIGRYGACSATARWTSRSRSAALTLAARENLDNLTFVINCNLQRLDGPVRGNGQIIQELEALFTGAGWNVIKVLWGSRLGRACSRATRTMRCCAGSPRPSTAQYQTLGANDGALQPRAFLRARSRSCTRWSRT